MDSQMSQFKESPFPDNLPLYSGLLFTPDLYFDLNDCDQVRETLDVFSEIEIRGRVIDQFGKPLKGAMIEMWHHADWGLFGMDLESSCAPTDPDGQDWKMAVTDENGGYFFKTEKRLTADGREATAIHFKVTDENGNITLAKLYPPTEMGKLYSAEKGCRSIGRLFKEAIEFDIELLQ